MANLVTTKDRSVIPCNYDSISFTLNASEEFNKKYIYRKLKIHFRHIYPSSYANFSHIKCSVRVLLLFLNQ